MYSGRSFLVFSLVTILSTPTAFSYNNWCTKKTDQYLDIMVKQPYWHAYIKSASHIPTIKFNKDIMLKSVVNSEHRLEIQEYLSVYERQPCRINVYIEYLGDQDRNVLIKNGATLSYAKQVTDVTFKNTEGLKIKTDKLLINFRIGRVYNDCTGDDLVKASNKAGFTFSFYHPEDALDCLDPQIKKETDVISVLDPDSESNS